MIPRDDRRTEEEVDATMGALMSRPPFEWEEDHPGHCYICHCANEGLCGPDCKQTIIEVPDDPQSSEDVEELLGMLAAEGFSTHYRPTTGEIVINGGEAVVTMLSDDSSQAER